ncbi:MAG: hypothetical protein QOC71_231 [Thermoplasmata archaeon]|jgi:hypothetical protein|nr:hypothetical protein [Thermoplasmata archaeon]
MRSAALLSMAVLATVMAASLVMAQPPTYSEAYQVRAAVGDIPTTTPSEPANAWNIEQRVLVQAGASAQTVTLQLPLGSSMVNASCTCGAQPTINGRDVTFQVSGSGQQTVTVLTSQPTSRAFGFEVLRPSVATETVVVLYVPTAYEVETPVDGESPGLSTDGSAHIMQYRGAAVPNPFWASLHASNGGPASQPSSSGGLAINPWLMLGIGVLLGIILWAVLVSRGAVQAKSRKQVASAAAHVEAARDEPVAVLEGRKRALLAALKEIEVAKMNNEMPNEVYDAVKADLKKQAVTVMRALETATAAGDAKA